jgi:hypothetical protein
MKTAFVLALLALVVVGIVLFARRGRAATQAAQEDKGGMAVAMRLRILSSSPEQNAIAVPRTPNGVWGLVMDMGFDGGAATLVALIDGNASLYIGEQSGVIGGFGHERVRVAATAAAKAAEVPAASFTPSKIEPLPPDGLVRFYALSRRGLLSSEVVAADKLAGGGHPMSPLFAAANELITQLRLTSGE